MTAQHKHRNNGRRFTHHADKQRQTGHYNWSHWEVHSTTGWCWVWHSTPDPQHCQAAKDPRLRAGQVFRRARTRFLPFRDCGLRRSGRESHLQMGRGREWKINTCKYLQALCTNKLMRWDLRVSSKRVLGALPTYNLVFGVIILLLAVTGKSRKKLRHRCSVLLPN